MKKIISTTLVLAMVLSLMSFGTLSASADESFVDYIIYHDLDVNSGDDGLYGIFTAGYRFDSTYVYIPVSSVDGAAHYVNKTNPSKSVLAYSVPIEGKTEPIVVDYIARNKGGSRGYMPMIAGTFATKVASAPSNVTGSGAFVGFSGDPVSSTKDYTGSYTSTAHMYITNDTTASYKFVIDPVKKTVTPYMNDAVAADVWTIADGETAVHFAHVFRNDDANNSANSDANEDGTLEGKWFDLYYMAAYNDAATPDFTVKSYSTTEAVVQFNTPVTEATAAAMTVDGDAVTAAESLSKAEDQVNIFKLTFASALTAGSHTIAAAGTSLTGKTINASKSLDVALVEPASIDGVVLNSVENAFVKNGDFITLKESNGTLSIEDDGSLLFAQSESGIGDGRFKTIPLNPNGTDTGKLVLDFDVTSNRTKTGFYLKHGVSGTTNCALYGGDMPKGQGRIVNVKVIIDYDTQTYSLYIDGVKTEVADNETKTYFTGKTAALLIYFTNVNKVDDVLGYATVENFAAYKIPSSTLDNAVVSSDAKDGGKAVQFTMPVDTVNSVATINGKQYGVVNAHRSGFVNTYAVDTSSLDAGTYDVTLNAVALEDSTKTATVNFQITLTGDRVIFTNGLATIDEELVGRVRVTAENNRNSEICPLLLVAQYDGEDVFDDVESVKTYVNAYEAAELYCRNIVNEGDYIKGYIWNSKTSAKPYCTPIEQ